MISESVHDEIQNLFRTVLKQPDLNLLPEMTARDVPGWTSLTHVRLMVAIEEKFEIRMAASEIVGFRNYGELLELVKRKAAA